MGPSSSLMGLRFLLGCTFILWFFSGCWEPQRGPCTWWTPTQLCVTLFFPGIWWQQAFSIRPSHSSQLIWESQLHVSHIFASVKGIAFSVALFWDKNILSSNCFSRQRVGLQMFISSIRVASVSYNFLPVFKLLSPCFVQQNICSISIMIKCQLRHLWKYEIHPLKTSPLDLESRILRCYGHFKQSRAKSTSNFAMEWGFTSKSALIV